MALYKPSDQTLETRQIMDATMRTQEEEVDDDEEHEELEKLEAEVKQMADKILHFRTTLPDQLKAAFSLLASSTLRLRPDNPTTSGDPSLDPGGSSQIGEGTSSTNEDDMIAEKFRMLGEKTSRNASQVPILLKRMKDCISMMEKSNKHNYSIHPVFKNTRPT